MSIDITAGPYSNGRGRTCKSCITPSLLHDDCCLGDVGVCMMLVHVCRVIFLEHLPANVVRMEPTTVLVGGTNMHILQTLRRSCRPAVVHVTCQPQQQIIVQQQVSCPQHIPIVSASMVPVSVHGGVGGDMHGNRGEDFQHREYDCSDSALEDGNVDGAVAYYNPYPQSSSTSANGYGYRGSQVVPITSSVDDDGYAGNGGMYKSTYHHLPQATAVYK